MAANKTKPTLVNPHDFIEAIEDPVKKADSKTLLAMIGRITSAKPKMWGPSIIGFDEYHYKYESGREGSFFQAGFAPRKNELVVYLLGVFEEQDTLRAKLGKHKMGKSCLYIKRLETIDMTVLEQLITKSVATIRAQYPA